MVSTVRSVVPPSTRGVSLVEILITLVIIALGLLGLAGMQTRLQSLDMESYQRSQALLLLNDMANRISANRSDAASYVTSTALGVGSSCPTTTTKLVDRDKMEWCNLLLGASETAGSGLNLQNQGAMIGGRGCVETVGSGVDAYYLVTVAWQGLTPVVAPPSSNTCGINQYDTAGTACVSDKCRRIVTTVVKVGAL